MTKKTVLLSSIIVIALAGISLVVWRGLIMGGQAQLASAGLVAVSPDGTPLPVSAKSSSLTAQSKNNVMQTAGDWTVLLNLSPFPPTMRDATEFAATLSDRNGQSIKDAKISLDLSMPGMYMPPNQFDLIPDGAGNYVSQGLFTMRGLWLIEVKITSDGVTKSVFYEVVL